MTSDQPTRPAAVTVSAEQFKTLLAALDDAAEYKRGLAATCAYCADTSPAPPASGAPSRRRL